MSVKRSGPIESDSTTTIYVRNLKKSAGRFIVLFFLFTFILTLIKFPFDKIEGLAKSFVQKELKQNAHLNVQMEEFNLSLLFGLKVSAVKVAIQDASPHPAFAGWMKFDSVEISPSLFSLLFGQQIVTAKLVQGKAQVDLFGVKTAKSVKLNLQLKEVDLLKLPITDMLAHVQTFGVLNGKADISMNPDDLTSLSGLVDVKLSDWGLNAQTIFGFKLPHVGVSQGILQLDFKTSKMMITKFELGVAPYDKDDLYGRVHGDLQLVRVFAESVANFTMTFSLSEKIFKAIPFLDQLISDGKQLDGTYSYKVSGPLNNLEREPVK
jgi:type II secretion system protein N